MLPAYACVTGLEDWQLKELAFTIFTGCGGQAGSFELLQYVRLQLEVGVHL